MGRPVDRAKWRLWAERLRRFRNSGMRAAAWCRQEGLPLHLFYIWRRKLQSLAAAESRNHIPAAGGWGRWGCGRGGRGGGGAMAHGGGRMGMVRAFKASRPLLGGSWRPVGCWRRPEPRRAGGQL